MRYPLRVWTPDDADYPYRLQSCHDKPNPLYVRGNIPTESRHVVAIVGTRRPTERGKELTETLVRELHERLDDLVIVSGGAYWIDIAAHRDRIYPSQHRPEAEAAMENGGVVSEYELGVEPYAPYFIQRNRIIAGMADAVVVVESHAHGGSLTTALKAKAYDRALFAFPGRPNDPASEGCNGLIRDGRARLITSAEDLIKAMEWKTKQTATGGVQTSLIGLMDDLTKEQQLILTKLQEAEDGMHINLLVKETGMAYEEVASELTMLEIEGYVRALPGGIYYKNLQ